jgi:tetratricopeptide (TPR) repeat protein
MKNRILICFTLLAFCFSFSASAQYDVSKVNKKAIDAYNKGLEKAQDGKYDEAIESLQEAIRKDARYIDAYLSLAGVYGQMKNYQESISSYEKAFALDSNYTATYHLPYAINLAGLGRFEEALKAITSLLDNPNISDNTRKAAEYRKKSFQFAVDFANVHANDAYVFAPKNLGDGVNTTESEYFPTLPIEGKQLIFTRRLNNFNEDFFGSVNKGDSWEKAFHLQGGINTPQNEGAQNISQDGNWLVFTGCNRRDGYGSCDLYISYLTDNGWSEASNLGDQINTEDWESQPCLSPDKRDLYFASRRPGGYGGSDIYVSHRQSNGRWSKPENLGPEIKPCILLPMAGLVMAMKIFFSPARMHRENGQSPRTLVIPLTPQALKALCLLRPMEKPLTTPATEVTAKAGWIFIALNYVPIFVRIKHFG